MSTHRTPCLLTILEPVLGCDSEPFQRGGVQGQVTLSGQPIPKGTIIFIPQGNQPVHRARPKSWTASTSCPPAKDLRWERIVWRSWPVRRRPAGSRPAAPSRHAGDATEHVLAQYNHQSQLQVEIQAGVNQHDFPLEARNAEPHVLHGLTENRSPGPLPNCQSNRPTGESGSALQSNHFAASRSANSDRGTGAASSHHFALQQFLRGLVLFTLFWNSGTRCW